MPRGIHHTMPRRQVTDEGDGHFICCIRSEKKTTTEAQRKGGRGKRLGIHLVFFQVRSVKREKDEDEEETRRDVRRAGACHRGEGRNAEFCDG